MNTIVFQGADRLGYNTDYRAAMDCIEEIFGIDKSRERPMQGLTALVLGAGGVSRAIAWGLRQRSADVVIASRTFERAEILAAEIGCRAVAWNDRHNVKLNLLINGTPIGMHPDMDSSPIDKELLTKLGELLVVFDTVYNPENTLLIKQAKGCRTVASSRAWTCLSDRRRINTNCLPVAMPPQS